MVFLLPGDPARLIAGGRAADPAVLESIRAEWGLDRPAVVQYGVYMGKLLRGDLGTSYIQHRSVASILAEGLPPTLILAVAGVLLAGLLGLTLGSAAAWWKDRAADTVILIVALVGASTPVFWLGLLLMLLFASHLQWLPVLGYGMDGAFVPLTSIRLPEWDHLVLPALTLSLVSMGSITRITRASLVEAGTAEFLQAARARGAGSLRVFTRHALRNALVPVITVLGLDFASLLGGAVATESIFAWPGLGKMLVRAINLRDLPVVEGCALFLTLVFVLASLALDMLYLVLDPRVQYARPR